MSLTGRRVLLGVTGGIAAYKIPLLVRRLLEAGADVRVVRTASAAQFVTDTTLGVLSQHAVSSDLFEPTSEFPVLHVGLAQWADLFLIAPATANCLAKMAHGLADDLLTCICLATTAPILVAPAMEEHMLEHVQVAANMRRLQEQGIGWIDPASGPLASGASGRGRMAEIHDIVAAVEGRLAQDLDLSGRRLLVTAGPTLEDVDPVRFIGNRSSGKMGYALARRARQRGAQVVLVSGPTSLETPDGVERVDVRSALQMLAACQDHFGGVDAAIMAAAVADYRPAEASAQKIKRGVGSTSIELVANPDIAATLGQDKGERILVAFALETTQGIEHAREKLKKKNADFVVLNDLGDAGAGFEVDTNVVTLVDRAGERKIPQMDKEQVADVILDEVLQCLENR